MKKILLVVTASIVILISSLVFISYTRTSIAADHNVIGISLVRLAPPGSVYDWIGGVPAMTDNINYDWVGGKIFVRLEVVVGEPAITVSPVSYSFGVVAESSTPSTTTTYFTIANTSTMQTDQTIGVTTATWGGGVTWAHSDTATPGTNTAGLKANKGGIWGTGDVIVKYSAPWNYIAENQLANTNYSFGLKLIAPTAFTDGVQKQIIVRITAVAG